MKLFNFVTVLSCYLILVTSARTQEILRPIEISEEIPKALRHTSTFSIEKRDLSLEGETGLKDLFKKGNVDVIGGERPGNQKLHIRGIDSNKLVILLDQIRQYRKAIHDSDLPMSMDFINQVDVYKGPLASLYGGGSIGGGVMFKTYDPYDFLKDQSFGGRMASRLDSVNELLGESLLLATKLPAGALLVGTSFYHHGDTKLSSGEDLDYSGQKNRSGLLKYQYKKDHKMDFSLMTSLSHTEATTPSNAESNLSSRNPLVHKEDSRKAYSATFRGRYTDLLNPNFFISYTDQKTDERQFDTQEIEIQTLETWQGNFFNHFKLGNQVLTSGYEYTVDKTDGIDALGASLDEFPKGKGVTHGIYLRSALNMMWKTKLIPSIRYDNYELTSPSFDAKNKEGQTTFGLQWEKEFHLGKVSLSYGQAFNPPRIQDLYISGLHFPAFASFPNNFFIANPYLRPETSENYELGVKKYYEYNHYTAGMEFNVFMTKAKDFIQREVDINAGVTQFQNKSRVEIYGGEVGIFTEVLPGLIFDLNFALQRGHDLTANVPLTTTSANTWNMGLKLVDTHLLNFKYDFYLVERQKTQIANIGQTPGYSYHDLSINYQTKPWDLTLKVSNIFDKVYRKFGNYNFAAGRSIKLHTAYEF